MNSECTEEQEISDLEYVIDTLNRLEKQTDCEIEIEEDDEIPLNLPDLNESFEKENIIITQIEENICEVKSKIYFLKKDEKLKKHTILNEHNYE